MLKVYIPNDRISGVSEKQMFYLIRPFFADQLYGNDPLRMRSWSVDPDQIQCTDVISEAGLFLIPYHIQDYLNKGHRALLARYDRMCADNRIKGYGMIRGDFGEAYKEYPNLYYLRMGGFRSQLSQQNIGMSFALSDQLPKLYHRETIMEREWSENPVLGFCGHSDNTLIKKYKEQVKFLRENVKRFMKKPFRTDYEPLFPSAYERYKLLEKLEESGLKTNFIHRKNYRAGAVSDEEREKSTLEYYNNTVSSDYVLCLRGGGNFSVRLYETLMMGRIPVYIDTDCLLPFPDKIDWQKHVVWVDWKDRFRIPEMVTKFHRSLSPEQFSNIQEENRKLWKETLSIQGIIKLLAS